MRHTMGVEESHRYGRLDRKIDVLWNVARLGGNFHSVEFGDHNADHAPVPVKKRTAAVARLNWSGDLKEPAIIPKPNKSGDVSGNYIAAGGKPSRQRESIGNDVFPSFTDWRQLAH